MGSGAGAGPGLRVTELARGLFAVLGPGGDSNSGFVLGPRGVLVIDAQQNEPQARALLDAVREAGGGPIRTLVNTHYHGDHVFGNPVFSPETEIVAHARCLQRLVDALRAAGVGAGARLPERLALGLTFGMNLFDLVPEGDPGREFFRWRYEVGGFAAARIRVPTLAIEGDCTFHVGDRRLVLRHLGPGHTDGDLVAWFPEDGVVFVADLIFHGRFPWLGDSDVPAWIARLEDVARLAPRTVVPGHGEPVTVAEVLAFRDLLVSVLAQAEGAVREGVEEAAAVARARLPTYEGLPRYKEWMPIAVRKLYRDLAAERGGVRAGRAAGATPGRGTPVR